MSTVQRIAKNTMALGLSQIITSAAGMILFIFIARFLGDVEFGKFSFAQSFTGILVIFADVGLSSFTIREVARDRELASKYLGNVALIKLLLSGITFTLIILIINLMDYPKDTTFIVYLFGISTILNSFSMFFRSIFKAFERMEYEAYLNITRSAIKTSTGLLLIFYGYGLIEVVYVFVFAEIINLFLSLFVTVKRFAKPTVEIDFKLWRHLISGALPFCMTLVVGMLYLRIDVVMLSVMKGDAAVGWYNAACTIVYGLVFIPNILSSAVFPVMSRLFTSSTDALKVMIEKFAKYSFITALPILIILIVLADEFITIIYGNEFINSIITLQILSVYLSMRFVNHATGFTLSSTNKEHLRAFSAAIAAGSNIILNLFLIPKYSYVGAAVATVLTEVVLFSFYYYFTAKHFHRLPLQKTLLKPLISCLTVFGFIYYLREINPYLLASLSVIIYLTILFLIKTFDSDDISLFEDITNSFLKRGTKGD